MSSSEATFHKVSQVRTFVAQVVRIDGCTGFDQRHGAANVFPAIDADDGADARMEGAVPHR